MKYIEKGPEPESLINWNALANDNWWPTYDNMPTPVKNQVKDTLMQEQGYICCYCERRLIADDAHIEHFRPRSDPAVDDLDFANMLCSCQNRLEKGEPRHCGNLKEDWFDEDLLISPLNPDCETRFLFTADGGIYAKNGAGDAAAETTIKKLGLDIPKLKDLRKNAIAPFLDETLDDKEFADFVSAYLAEREQGMFNEFYMTIKDLFG